MKSKKKYNRNKKANPYTLKQFQTGGLTGFDGFGTDFNTSNVPMPSNVPTPDNLSRLGTRAAKMGNVSGMPWDTLANVGVKGIEMFAPNQTMYGQEIDGKGESVAKGALKGAAIGAGVGAIGAGVGAIVGGIGGYMKNKKQSESIQALLANTKSNVSQNPYGVPTMEDGGIPSMGNEMVNQPLINIEKGELNVDLESGDILDDYDTAQFKPHSKGKSKEHLGNFVEATKNGVVIPKKWRDEYIKNTSARKGIIRDVLNKQVDRELYGKDADGNTKSFAKMKDGGVQQYIFGGIEEDPNRSPMDLREEDPLFDATFNSYNQSADPLYQNQNTADTNPLYNFQNVNHNIPSNYVETNPSTVKPSVVDTQDSQPWTVGDNSLIGNPFAGPTSNSPGMDNNVWTTGNTIGAVGNVVGGLGPLAMTLANGRDEDETNEFANVEGAAINELSDVFSRGKENTFANIRRQANKASNLNRNRTSSFASLLANEQNILDTTGRSLGEAGLGYDTNEASAKSQLRFQGDMRDSMGRQDALNRLDQNRDNLYSNLASNLTNAGNMTQAMGKNLNTNEVNKTKLNVLKQISPDFDIDQAGNITFKGNKINV